MKAAQIFILLIIIRGLMNIMLTGNRSLIFIISVDWIKEYEIKNSRTVTYFKSSALLLTKIFIAVKDKLQTYFATTYARSGINQMSILKNSK